MTTGKSKTPSHNKYVEEISDILGIILRSEDKSFFRVISAFFLSKITSNMRVVVKTKDRGNVVTNMYGVALAPSGFGKGRSMGILEDQIMGGFFTKFSRDVVDLIAERNLVGLATQRSVMKGTQYDDEYEKVRKEYEDCGEFMISASEGTVPAIKQYRHKLLLANIGAISFIVDEIGSNIENVADVLDIGLELYDQGKTKDKMTKNTAENKRVKGISGRTPTNILMFGTQRKLFDGGKAENSFINYLTAGYARRSLFAYSECKNHFDDSVTPQEIFQRVVDASVVDKMDTLNNYFSNLAIEAYANMSITIPDAISIDLIAYQLDCEKRASQLSRYDENSIAELEHRYFRVLKLMGVFAFIDRRDEVNEFDLREAITLVEESGEAFAQIMDRDKPYMILAKYITESKTELTHSDLSENLPFYPKSSAQRNDMMLFAKAWGYKEGYLIKTNVVEGVDFISGESLMVTDMDKILVSASNSANDGYKGFQVPFNQLHKVACNPDKYWMNHLLQGSNALESSCEEGFNIVTFEVSNKTFPAINFTELFKDFTYFMKEVDADNYQVTLPINYTLGLSQVEYKQFIESFLLWLPFKPKVIFQERLTRKKGTKSNYVYNEGELVDVIPFVPNTSKNETFKKNVETFSSHNFIERWFANKIVIGNKYDVLVEYATYLANNSTPFNELSTKVHDFNDRTEHPITGVDIDNHLISYIHKNFYI